MFFGIPTWKYFSASVTKNVSWLMVHSIPAVQGKHNFSFLPMTSVRDYRITVK